MLPRLHLITDTRSGHDPLPDVESALHAGVGVIQVRSKDRGDRDLLTLAREVVHRARPFSATVIVNDRADIAVAARAHGVHVGADDLPIPEVRRIVGAGGLVGGTARDPAAARQAVAEGADYLGAGPAFRTDTKSGLPDPLGVEGVSAVAGAVDVPVLAIGGIDRSHIADLLRAGVHGVAVVSAVSTSADPRATAAELLTAIHATAGRR